MDRGAKGLLTSVFTATAQGQVMSPRCSRVSSIVFRLAALIFPFLFFVVYCLGVEGDI